jgi:perosamine synthetase
LSDPGPKRTASEAGAPGAGTIPLSVPHLAGNEWQYVKECFDTNWVSSVGPFVTRFERMMAERSRRAHAVATVNGTAALHIALIVAGVAPDDEVLMPAMTFIAPANAVRYVGAWPVFIDVEPTYWQLDPARLADVVARECEWRGGALWNRTTGRRVRAVLPVDILGHPVDADPILEIARSRDLAVVEDATESLGARYKDRVAGQLGDVACFSFNGNKIVTAGGGGMIVTDNARWAERARYLTTQAKDDPVEYIHHEVGYNYRLTNVQAAIGVAQLEQLEQHILCKRGVAEAYASAFAEVPGLRLMAEAPWAFSSFWLYTVLVDEAEYGTSSRDLRRRLAASGIEARPLWQPLHLSRAHRASPSYCGDVAEALYRNALSLPSSVGLAPEDQQRVISVVAAARTTGSR